MQVRWFKDNQELSTGGRYRVDIGERHAFLYIAKADKCDDGPYRLTLENDLGSDSAVLKVQINGTPEKSQIPNKLRLKIF